MKHAINIPEAAVKKTAHDDDDRLGAMTGGAESSSALGSCLTCVGTVLSGEGPAVMY
jgi:hypothetical protein